jgi:hypothetical protein
MAGYPNGIDFVQQLRNAERVYEHTPSILVYRRIREVINGTLSTTYSRHQGSPFGKGSCAGLIIRVVDNVLPMRYDDEMRWNDADFGTSDEVCWAKIVSIENTHLIYPHWPTIFSIEGWMCKAGFFNKALRRRYFRLSPQDGKLSYFEDDRSGSLCRGEIDVTAMKVVQLPGSDFITLEPRENMCVGARTYVLHVTNASARRFWASMLEVGGFGVARVTRLLKGDDIRPESHARVEPPQCLAGEVKLRAMSDPSARASSIIPSTEFDTDFHEPRAEGALQSKSDFLQDFLQSKPGALPFALAGESCSNPVPKPVLRASLKAIECPICLEHFGEEHVCCTLPCGHSLCISHLQHVEKCPMCKATIPSSYSAKPSYMMMTMASQMSHLCSQLGEREVEDGGRVTGIAI